MPEIYGLVLSGGMSARMGKRKGALTYYNKPQEEHLYELLQQSLSKVYISTKDSLGPKNLPLITDHFKINSPLNGILSAFKKHPNVAWLVVACDMPLITSKEIDELVSFRDIHKMATCFLSTDNKPHPLFSIYEPKAFPLLLKQSKNNPSPRHFLMTQAVKTVDKKDKDFLLSVDEPSQFERVKSLILRGKM
ncbi:NTP transferase domain-containing protein [Fulvivirga aurantia]|uniref:NTP transferase domain-containing protein n=1 Tax=Fulvivirga aurantia TaxID=2529383 RepID=UPI0016240E51|nr:NTP transferase domain-containing protein [Fulvivirga aurantia]